MVRGGVILREDGWFFVLLTLLNLPIFIQAFFYNHQVIPFGEGLLNWLPFWMGAFFILLLTVALNVLLKRLPRVKKFLQATTITLFMVIFLANAFLLYKFDLPLNMNMIQLAMGTNPLTAKQFISNYVLSLPVLVGIVAIIAFVVLMIKGLKKFFRARSEERLKRFSFDLMIIFLPLIIFYCASIVKLTAEHVNIMFGQTTLGRFAGIVNYLVSNNPLGDESKIFALMDEQLETEKILDNESTIPYVIFILGEATTRNHMQLYGYNLPTTPLLQARYDGGEIFRFNDTISCGNYTSQAMSLIFTFAEKDTDDWYLHANIFDIIRRAGYHTLWLSNQSPLGFWGNLDRIYAARCDEEIFIESKEKFSAKREFDNVLLPELDKFISEPHEKNFMVIHLYGTHLTYSERYPAEFEKFTAADENKPTDEGKKITAEYDNAVLYNDFIVNEIIRRFEDKNALIIYISDHGEEVFENGREFAGHSMEEVGNRSMIEIPALIWASKSFREHYPEKISALAAAVDKPYRTDFLIHAMPELMDIRTISFDPTKSILNASFDSTRPRIYNGEPYVK